MDTQLVSNLDLSELLHAENKIERAMLGAFNEVGIELRHINQRRLYLLRYSTFEEYCDQRWEMTSQRAHQLMTASTIVENLSTNVDFVDRLPSRESHVRPLQELKDAKQQAEVWRRIVQNNNGNDITAKIVEAEVERYKAALDKNYITLAEWNDDQRWEGSYQSNPMNEANDNIEWAAFSWNPVTGCLHDCPYCYARDIANRFYPQKFEASFYPGRLNAPAVTKPIKPRWKDDFGIDKVFTCSMADLFGKWVPDEWINAVLKAIGDNPQWTFLLLTKFPIRMAEFTYPANVWLGTTVDRQYAVDRAEKVFRKIKASGFAGICWLSCEPMLERLTFTSLDMFDWLVIGGASSSTQTPEYLPPMDDIIYLHNQGRAAGLPIYQKTNLIPGMRDAQRLREYPR